MTAVIRRPGDALEAGGYFAGELASMGWDEIEATCRRSAQSGDVSVTVVAATDAEGHRVDAQSDIHGAVDREALTIVSVRTHPSEPGESVSEDESDRRCVHPDG